MSITGGNKETLEEMAATVAHEIKNPLALALANLDIIKISDTEGKFTKNCRVIEKELYKINALVLDMIHTVREDEKEERINLSEMLQNLKSEYAAAYESLTFTWRPADVNMIFYGPPKKIRMVFTNLLNNAVEAVGLDGRIEIEEENSLYELRVMIRDNGVGLKEEIDWEKDYYTTKENGTGVGLRYCRNTIAQYGGRFFLKNRPEGGCEAIIELPSQNG